MYKIFFILFLLGLCSYISKWDEKFIFKLDKKRVASFSTLDNLPVESGSKTSPNIKKKIKSESRDKKSSY